MQYSDCPITFFHVLNSIESRSLFTEIEQCQNKIKNIKRSGILSNNVIKTKMFEIWVDFILSDVWNSLEFPYFSFCVSLNLTEAENGKNFLKCATVLKNTRQCIFLSGEVLLILINSVHSFGKLSTDACS